MPMHTAQADTASKMSSFYDVKEIAVGSGGDFVYLLYHDSTLHYLPINERNRVPEDEQSRPIPLFEPQKLCKTIDVDPVGVLWCVSMDSKLFEFDGYDLQWVENQVKNDFGAELVYCSKLQVNLHRMDWIHDDLHKIVTVARRNGNNFFFSFP